MLLADIYRKGSYQNNLTLPARNTNYIWFNENVKNEFTSVSWNKITTDSLDGLPWLIGSGWEEDYKCSAGITESLRIEGGMSSVHFFITKTAGMVKTPLHITSSVELKKLINPIDSTAKAVSLIALTQRDLARNDYKLVGYVAPFSEDYLVQSVRLNTFGCRNHRPQQVIFLVSRSGDIQKAAEEMLSPEPNGLGPYTCVD